MSWKASPHGELTLYRSELLAAQPGIGHAVSTRAGGVSGGPFASLNLASGPGDDPEKAAENRRRFCSAAGASAKRVSRCRQVLGNSIHVIHQPDAVGKLGEADAIVTSLPDTPLLTLSADCLLVLLYDPVKMAVGNVHGSRRGLLGRIVERAVHRMTDEFHSRPQNLLAALGPAIGPCCYNLSPQALEEWKKDRGGHDGALRGETLDLWTEASDQLERAGVNPDNVDEARICTKCNPDRFFSYRNDGPKTGRFGALIWLR